MKLALGSAQFGMDYGVSNTKGRVPAKEIAKILELAVRSGVELVDTAAAYGAAEETLGNCLYQFPTLKVVTKTTSLSKFDDNLKRLRKQRVYGLLCHNASPFFKDAEGTARELQKIKSSGKAEKVGVAVYSPDEINRILQTFTPDIIQLPLNVIDQRAVSMLSGLVSRGIEIHARSIFLQGALLMRPELFTGNLALERRRFQSFHEECKKVNTTPMQAALQFVKQHSSVSQMVVGCCTSVEFQEILNAFQAVPCTFDYAPYSSQTERLINPSLW